MCGKRARKQLYGTAVALIGVIAPSVALSQEAPHARPYKVEETRMSYLISGDGASKRRITNKLTVTLLVKGKTVKSATHYGMLTVDAAKDDTGASLVDQTQGPSDEFRKLNRDRMWFFQDNPPEDKIKVDVPLSLPKRAADKLTTLKGSFKLRKITTKAHYVSDLADKVGQTIKHSALKDANVKLNIEKVQKSAGSVKLKLTDPDGRVKGISLVDQSGESVRHSRSSFTFDNVSTIQLRTSDGLPSGVRLKLNMVAGEPKTTKVSFDISDPIALP